LWEYSVILKIISRESAGKDKIKQVAVVFRKPWPFLSKTLLCLSVNVELTSTIQKVKLATSRSDEAQENDSWLFC